MATPKLTAREKALRAADRAYWRWLLEGVDDGRFGQAMDQAWSAELELDGCPPECPYCRDIPWWLVPRR